MDQQTRAQAARALLDARTSGTPIPPLTTTTIVGPGIIGNDLLGAAGER